MYRGRWPSCPARKAARWARLSGSGVLRGERGGLRVEVDADAEGGGKFVQGGQQQAAGAGAEVEDGAGFRAEARAASMRVSLNLGGG